MIMNKDRDIELVGGTIDIGNGTFEVNQDGDVIVNSGEITLGPVTIKEHFADLGAFRVSSDKMGMLYSTDPEQSIQIYSSASPDWERGMIQVSDRSGNHTRISSLAVGASSDLLITSMPKEEGWDPEWDSVKKNLVELWKRVQRLEDRL